MGYTYKLTNGSSILRSDGVSVPVSAPITDADYTTQLDGTKVLTRSFNVDYQEYEIWVSEGNAPTAADVISPNVGIFAQISALELGQSRAIREAAIGIAGAQDRLKALDAKIVDLRKQLVK